MDRKCCILWTIWLGGSLALWFGFFFGLIHPEIQLFTDYQPTVVNITSSQVVPYLCCYKSCASRCQNCAGYATATCTSMLATSTAGYCCDGYYCCSTCCSTCTSCSGSGSRRSCSTYSCNCYCCGSVSNRLCSIICPTCYRGVIRGDYQGATTYITNGTSISEFSTDQAAANAYIAQYSAGQTHKGYYNIYDNALFILNRSYTWWKFLLFSLPCASLIIFVVVVFVYNDCCPKCECDCSRSSSGSDSGAAAETSKGEYGDSSGSGTTKVVVEMKPTITPVVPGQGVVAPPAAYPAAYPTPYPVPGPYPAAGYPPGAYPPPGYPPQPGYPAPGYNYAVPPGGYPPAGGPPPPMPPAGGPPPPMPGMDGPPAPMPPSAPYADATAPPPAPFPQ